MSTSTHNGLWSASAARPSEAGRPLRPLWGVFALQDLMLLAYLAVLRLLLARAELSAAQTFCARATEVCMAVVLGAALIARMAPIVPALLRKATYRIGLVGVILANYLLLRDLLPVVRPDSVDATLYQIDVAIFGREPALALEAFNVRPVVEWFSFFYFSYFFICFGYMLTALWITRPGRQTTIFAIGTLVVYCGGQLGYTAVPGYGPVRFLAEQFQGPINGGFFWSTVWETVQAGSAMKDIFPSLHTAGPTWFTLYAFQRAKEDPRWRWPARISAFFAANIIFSTVFLRWHYGIDVLAGLTLAFLARFLAPRIAHMEETWRERRGFRGAWIFD